MPAKGNLPPSNNINSTTEYFNNYFVDRFTTSPNINDAVTGYFQSVTGDTEAGKTLASTVIYTALSQGLDPMSLIDEFKKLKAGKRTEVKTPISATSIVASYTTYDQILQHKDQYEVGQLFYTSVTNTFYRSYLANDEVLVQSIINYKRETVSVGSEQYEYNYYYLTYTQEQDELTPYLTVLLNQNRVNTSLLGIGNSPAVNKYIQRAILA
jgi:hypothetical protein